MPSKPSVEATSPVASTSDGGNPDRTGALKRRLVTVPVTLTAAVVVTALLPVLAVVAAAVDIVRFVITRKPFVAIRMLAFGWAYLATEVWALISLGIAWVIAGVGPGRSRRLLQSAFRLQERWARMLLWAFRRIFSVGLEVEGADVLAPGPIIVMMRHASIADTLLPNVLVTSATGIRLRYILKKELLVDPALDIAGNRLENVFVDRSGDTSAEVDRIRTLGTGLGEFDGMLIYPEGTRFTPAKQAKALESLSKRKSDLAERARGLRHVLPPRIGGPLGLLDLETDIVIAAHVGLDGFAEVKDIWDGKVIGGTLRVTFWRVASDDLPSGRSERVSWLMSQWERVDAWIDAQRRP